MTPDPIAVIQYVPVGSLRLINEAGPEGILFTLIAGALLSIIFLLGFEAWLRAKLLFILWRKAFESND